MGIMNSFPTLDGNQISSDEEQEEQEEQDSDPYIGVAFGSTYWNKGGVRFSLQFLHLEWSTECSYASKHAHKG